MTADPTPASRQPRGNRRAVLCAIAAIVVVVALAYRNTLEVPFVFDDRPAIRDNATLRTLWPLTTPLSPPRASGLGGRPLANLSFALSHALGGGGLRAHHLVNVLLHLGSALLLFGIVRRTPFGQARALPPTGVAAAAAVGWAAHPLATGAVTYLSQRTELLMAFCLLGTLYCFVRGWRIAAVVACACGMLSKETMAPAPLVVLLYDRTFLRGTFRAAWTRRRGTYLALAATWLVLAGVLTTGLHLRSVGFGLGVSPLDYALTECRAVLLYAKLALWPAPLVFDYGRAYAASGFVTVACVALVLAWVIAAVLALRRGGAPGFVLGGFLLLLAPTSSFIPVAETPIAENRAYLPLALVVVTLTAAGWRVMRLRGARIGAAALAAIACLTLTITRNHDYRSALALWTDTVAKRPQNARARFNLGVALLETQQPAEAAAEFTRAIALDPREPKSHDSLGNALLDLGRAAEALPHFARAVELEPNYPRAWFNFGTAHFQLGHWAEARDCFTHALRYDPRYAAAENALGNVFFQLEQPAQAIPHYEAALRLDPALVDAHYNCGSASLELGRVDDALAHFAAAVQLKPTDAELRNHRGAALVRAGRLADAIAEFEAALRLKPDYADARDNLAMTRAALTQPPR